MAVAILVYTNHRGYANGNPNVDASIYKNGDIISVQGADHRFSRLETCDESSDETQNFVQFFIDDDTTPEDVYPYMQPLLNEDGSLNRIRQYQFLPSEMNRARNPQNNGVLHYETLDDMVSRMRDLPPRAQSNQER